ncbi:MAG: TMEM165/GDT1 family protein [Thermodesulfobacteriota bacterium]|nr:TMEM165/GDT1 family protein [Thermodesulfobacteriota bacterium]
MDLKLIATVFGTVFLAEIADKTQVATFLFASKAPQEKLTVFLGSSLALILASAIAVTVGSALSHWIAPKYISYLAGACFIGIGIWIFTKA